jgi:hypothetical protein
VRHTDPWLLMCDPAEASVIYETLTRDIVPKRLVSPPSLDGDSWQLTAPQLSHWLDTL